MALQDLTPQLRTRLSKVERAVGWFVILAGMLLLAGFVYYAWKTAERKGWFVAKVHYSTSVNNAAGLKEGDPVILMGFPAGEITKVVPNSPTEWYGVTIFFNVMAPNFGYIWSDSMVKVTSDFLGHRYLEITKGKNGLPTVSEDHTNKTISAILKHNYVKTRREALEKENKELQRRNLPVVEVEESLKAEAKTNYSAFYEPGKETIFWIRPEESPALNERLENLAHQIETALPNILDLTNRVIAVLDQGTAAASSANTLLTDTRPLVKNLTEISENLRNPQGSLGEWLIPTNIKEQLTNVLTSANTTLGSANSTLTNTDAQITALALELDRTLENLSAITSNLNAQVSANTNLVKQISDAIVHADEFIQGLKRHWLLRSAFKTKDEDQTSAPAKNPKAGKWP
jgi:ABC-type transporter Mla subunit MlaD